LDAHGADFLGVDDGGLPKHMAKRRSASIGFSIRQCYARRSGGHRHSVFYLVLQFEVGRGAEAESQGYCLGGNLTRTWQQPRIYVCSSCRFHSRAGKMLVDRLCKALGRLGNLRRCVCTRRFGVAGYQCSSVQCGYMSLLDRPPIASGALARDSRFGECFNERFQYLIEFDEAKQLKKKQSCGDLVCLP
jgi:hypothetical protein